MDLLGKNPCIIQLMAVLCCAATKKKTSKNVWHENKRVIFLYSSYLEILKNK